MLLGLLTAGSPLSSLSLSESRVCEGVSSSLGSLPEPSIGRSSSGNKLSLSTTKTYIKVKYVKNLKVHTTSPAYCVGVKKGVGLKTEGSNKTIGQQILDQSFTFLLYQQEVLSKVSEYVREGANRADGYSREC